SSLFSRMKRLALINALIVFFYLISVLLDGFDIHADAGERVVYVLVGAGKDVVSKLSALEIQRRRVCHRVGEFLLKPRKASRIRSQRYELDFLLWIDAVARED